ncbi:MAG: glycoside hydrolase family 1 protein [Polyangia bacterium]
MSAESVTPQGWSRGKKILFGTVGLLSLLVPTLLYPWFGARRLAPVRSPSRTEPPWLLPPGFLWGTATAAFQIESTHDDDWAAFERDAVTNRRFDSLGPGQAKPGHIHNLGAYSDEIRAKKTDFDSRIDSDLEMLARMKHNAYRFSISWSRLFPRADMQEPDPEGIRYYQKVFDALERHKITPLVTLFHFASPGWLWQEQDGKRGFERADALAHFERFVKAVVKHFGARSRHFCTLNEPMVYLYNGYMEGVFPPFEKRGDPVRLAPLMEQLLRAHLLAYRLLKEDAQRRGVQIEVGYAQHMRAFEPLRNWAPLDRITARIIEQAFIWDFTDAVASGVLAVTNTPYRKEIPGLAGTQDYLGVNYYGRFYIKSDVLHPTKFQVLMHDPEHAADDLPNDLGWASYPRGFRTLLVRAGQRYRIPIYVLEHGTADNKDNDTDRQRILVDHVREMALARQSGADVRGYFHWSAIDNFEWAEGFEARFGLVKVDYADGFKRTPRPSAALYTRLIEANGVSAELAREYGPWPE